MISSRIMAFLAVVIFFLLQIFFVSLGFPFNPPFLFIVAVHYALSEGPIFGVWIGVLCGLIQEPLVLGRFGGESIALSLAAYGCSRVSGPFFGDSFFSRFVLPTTAFFFYTGIRMLWHRYAAYSEPPSFEIPTTWFWEALSVFMLAPAFFSTMDRLTQRPAQRRERV